jgi:restriction system protein
MAVWLVRAGKSGEGEEIALTQGLAVIGWGDVGDLSDITSKAQLSDRMATAYPTAKLKTLINWGGQVWTFLKAIEKNDLVVLPLKSTSAIAIGTVTGPYVYRADLPEFARHTRTVSWIRDDLPRSTFDQDILYTMGAFLTVCRISRNNAEERIRATLAGKPKPHPIVDIGEPTIAVAEEEGQINLAQQAEDQIREFIGDRFKGHDLARLVTALLLAQGYQVQMSPPGADGGVDVIAGRGPLGFDPPRLVVQVKSSVEPVDVKVLRELQGVMKGFGAEQGLLIAWGGFKRTVIDEARRQYFAIRLWDSGALVAELMSSYDRLPGDIRAELPLKRVWVMVPEE